MAVKSAIIKFEKLLHQTDRAYLIQVHNKEHWIPKKLCRNFITNKKLGGNVSIPVFLYERITGIPVGEIDLKDATCIVEVHVPQKVLKKEITLNEQLIKDTGRSNK